MLRRQLGSGMSLRLWSPHHAGSGSGLSEAQCSVQSVRGASHSNNIETTTLTQLNSHTLHIMDTDVKTEPDERFTERMSEGDKAIREILHLLEDSSRMNGEDESKTKTLLHHAILCASFLCLILFLAIIVLHRKYSRLSRLSTTSLENQNHQPLDTVIVISDERRVDTVVTCDNTALASTNV